MLNNSLVVVDEVLKQSTNGFFGTYGDKETGLNIAENITAYDHIISNVPNEMFFGTRDCIVEFLKGVFLAHQYRVHSSNELYLKHVQILLSKFGVLSSISKDYNDENVLYLDSINEIYEIDDC